MSIITIGDQTLQAYSYRVDTPWENFSKLLEFVTTRTVEVQEYLFAKEKKKDGTQHFQGILFFKENVQINGMEFRNVQKRTWITKTNQPVSFKKARKISSLMKYCNDKEGNGIHTTLHKQEIEAIGQWKDKETTKKDLKKELVQLIRAVKHGIDEDNCPYQLLLTHDPEGEKPNWKKAEDVQMYLASLAIEVYLKAGVRPPPMKSLLFLALQEELISRITFAYIYYRL